MKLKPYALILSLGLLPVNEPAAALDADTEKEAAPPPITIEIPAPEIIPGATNPKLQGIVFNMGEKVRLGRTFSATEQAPEGCIERPENDTRYCLDPVAWPHGIGMLLRDNDVIHKGGQAIIRYDAGAVTQAHILFPAGKFIDVVEHLRNRFGAPTREEFVRIPVPEKDAVVNTVVRWRSVIAEGEKDMILEVRAHDDVRRPFPDVDHGFIWLYRDGAEPMFRRLSVVDLMVLRKRRIGSWPFN